MRLLSVRVAGIGAGYFSQFHYDAWRRIDGAKLVAVCDRELEKAETSGAPAYVDLSRMLDECAPDLLDVIVPPVAQAKAIETALEHGVKWIICQKPFCTSSEEAHAITAKAEAAGAHLVIHENFRFQPWYRRIKSLLVDGLVGDVQQMTFRLRPGDGQGPRAYLDRQPYFQKMERFLVHETAVHWIDTFRYLLGDPYAVYADLRRINPAIAGEDAGMILFDHPKGARALFDGNRHLDHAADNLRRTMGEACIEGAEGTLLLHGDGTLHFRAFGTVESTEIFPRDTWQGFGGDCVCALQTHVISAVLHGTHLENVAKEYLTVISVEEAVYASAESGKKIWLEET